MADLAAVRTQKKSMNMVLITMDTHLNSAARRAERELQKTIPGLSLKIHSAILLEHCFVWRDESLSYQ